MAEKNFTIEQERYLQKIIPGRLNSDVAEMMNDKYGLNYSAKTIGYWKNNRHIRSGVDTTFHKGYEPANKGKHQIPNGKSIETQFKVGHRPKNYMPVGSIVKKTDGHLWKKIRDDVPSRYCWKKLSRIVWERANGPVPKGYKIIFLDGNFAHCSLSNLAIVTLAAGLKMAQKHYFSKDPELTEFGKNTAELSSKAFKAKSKLEDRHENS